MENIKTDIIALKLWAKINLAGNYYPSPIGQIHITMKGIKETLNQPHKFKHQKNNAIYGIEKLLALSEFVKTINDIKGRPFLWHYLKIIIAENNSYIVIREDIQSGTKILYSIVDNIK